MMKAIKNFVNGLAFSMTVTVPGVSGGTIAIIMGFYAELLEAVNHFRKDVRKYLKFLAPLLLGIVIGILAFSSVIDYLLKRFSFPTMSFFIGLIIGIVPLIFLKVKEPGKKLNIKEIILIIVPVLSLILISHLKDVSVSGSVSVSDINAAYMIFIFFAGIIAAAALVIPGISGSFILLLFGIYDLAISSISSIKLLLNDITNIELIINITKVLLPLGIGIIIGGLSMARLIEKLLNNYHKIIYSVILGLLTGSVYSLFNEPIVFQSGMSVPVIITGAVTLISGAVISFLLGRKRL